MTKKQFKKRQADKVAMDKILQCNGKCGSIRVRKKKLAIDATWIAEDDLGIEIDIEPDIIGTCSVCEKKGVKVIKVSVEGKKKARLVCKKCGDEIFGGCGI